MIYSWLKIIVSIFFNFLNWLLQGKLPPFGSATIVVEEEERFLVVELPDRRLVFPGGFMTWKEQPFQTARREGKEETGLDISVGDLVSIYTYATKNWLAMSSVNFVFVGEVVGGHLRRSPEGIPYWSSEGELRQRCNTPTLAILDDYLAYRSRQMVNQVHHVS